MEAKPTFGERRQRELLQLLIKADPELARQREAEVRYSARVGRARAAATKARTEMEKWRDEPFMRHPALCDLAQVLELHPEAARDASELAWSVEYMRARRESSARRAAGERFPRVEFPKYPELP